MKRYFYLGLMMICFVAVFNFFYFIGVFSLVFYHMIPVRAIIAFTDIALHPLMFLGVSVMAALWSWPVGKKWWKIIYVDRVYHFARKSRH